MNSSAHNRHPELVSGSISPRGPELCGAAKPGRSAFIPCAGQTALWTLKQVQGDEPRVGHFASSPFPLGRGWGGGSSLASVLGLMASLPHPLPLPTGEGSQEAGVLA